MRITNFLTGALAALALSSVPAAAQGGWRVAYPEARDPMFSVMRQMFAQQDMLASLVEPLNEYFPVPRDVTVELAECGRPGAFYDAARPAVQLCYELVMELAESLMSDGEDDDLFVGAFALILLHQVGHAMVDQLDLPVSVPAEEAADQLTAVMVGFAEGELDSAAEGALALSDLRLDWENPGSGLAPLSGERLQKMLCLLYGANPGVHDWLVDEEHLAPERTAACEARYQEVQAEWIAMLAEHVAG